MSRSVFVFHSLGRRLESVAVSTGADRSFYAPLASAMVQLHHAVPILLRLISLVGVAFKCLQLPLALLQRVQYYVMAIYLTCLVLPTRL